MVSVPAATPWMVANAKRANVSQWIFRHVRIPIRFRTQKDAVISKKSHAARTPTATAAGRYGTRPGTISAAGVTFTVESRTSEAPCSTSAPSPVSARVRWTSVIVAGRRRANGRDLSTSPASTESVSTA